MPACLTISPGSELLVVMLTDFSPSITVTSLVFAEANAVIVTEQANRTVMTAVKILKPLLRVPTLSDIEFVIIKISFFLRISSFSDGCF